MIHTSDTSQPMDTIVLCGGPGTRLAEVTQSAIPKHLLQVGGKAMLEHAIEPFVGSRLIMATGVLGDQVRDFVEARKTALGIDVAYSHDPEPKGVIAAIIRAVQEYSLRSSFAITHGDEVLKGFDMQRMQAFHREKGAAITVLATSTTPAVRDFAMWMDADGRVLELKRSALSAEETVGAHFGVGTFIFEPEVVAALDPADSWEGFLRKLIAEGQLFCFTTEAAFFNLNSAGDLAAYQRALGKTSLQ
jgi:NDP-sugar pyrophosphorylase family protein